MGMTTAFEQGKQAVLGPSKNQTGEGEAELVMGVLTGSELGRETRTDRAGKANSTPGQDGLSCAVQHREQGPCPSPSWPHHHSSTP